MTHTLLKAGLVSLVLASPFALADSYNDKDGQVEIKLGLLLTMQDTFYSCTHASVTGANTATQITASQQAIGSTYYQLHEGNEKLNFTFGVQISASTQLNDALGATVIFDVQSGASDGTVYDLTGHNDGVGAGDGPRTVEHEYNFAPGVILDYGCFGVGAKYLITTHKIGTVDLDEKQLMVGFTTSTSLDLEDSMSGVEIGFQAWSTIRSKSSSAQNDYFNAAKAQNAAVGLGTTEAYYNNIQLTFAAALNVATM
ncbi:hypothetical protein OAT84_03165 [Gammaproteobacteria bacterium]|nr:hypothetical protein [Gammaproteobacteria bacterium]